MTFKKDLEFGKKYELKLIEILKPTKYKIKEGCFKPYDIKIYEGNHKIYYEVKTDRYTNKTNNVCIEHECSNKPSGINTTRADFYAYFVVKPDGQDLYIIPTIYIKEIIEKKLYHKNISGGDGLRSKFYLFNKNIFDAYLNV